MEKKKKNVVGIIAVLILILLTISITSFFVIRFVKKPVMGNLTIDNRATTEYVEEEKSELASRQIYFAGIEDATINENSIVILENLMENEEFMIKYVIADKDANTVIYETDLIPPGEHINWKASENLKIGENNLLIKQIPYYPIGDTFQELTSGINEVTLTLK